MTSKLSWEHILYLAKNKNPSPEKTLIKSDAEWRKLLSADVYSVTRLKGTERPFSSELCTSFKKGLYACACCEELLFDSSKKFDSGTGWPSFNAPINDSSIAYLHDKSHGMDRIEAICNCCKAHLGHVFPDGPPPSSIRFCINALALKADN